MKLKPIIKNKKGQSIFDIIIFMVIVFLLVIGFVLFKFVFNTVSNRMASIQTPANSPINITDISDKTFGLMNIGFNQLNLIGLVIIFGMIINIFVSNFMVKSHPAFFFIYIGITFLAVILSVFLSNSFEALMSNSALSSTFADFPALVYVMLYLPIWVTVIGFMGALFLYIGITRDEGTGGF